jgi:glycogen operon protein
MNPTHTFGEFKLRHGTPLPFGSSIVPGGVNFSVFSRHASSCELVLFKKHEQQPFVVIPFISEENDYNFVIGNVFTMIVFNLNYEEIEYAYCMDGPWKPKQGFRFDKSKYLLDPYAKLIGGRDIWKRQPDWNNPYQHRSRIVFDDFDWKNDRPLQIPFEDLVIYEMHVRSFTAHKSSGIKENKQGTFAAVREKIPYLKELGINCIELLPIHEFDEFENSRPNPSNPEELLVNYWGYSTVGFFSPKAGYAATGKFGMQVDELKKLIMDLHANGIEVILDVVFNHTAEGNERGPSISFRGIDNSTYYLLTPDGYYYNFSGTGNTMNCNNPIVRNMILDCLRYWASEFHIDGFRFDLAAILSRDENGAPMANPPLLESLAYDPILGNCKLIAEAWDAGGLYQVGSFPSWGRWAEWNGKFRDDIRKFLVGEAGMVGAVAQRVQGSPDLYNWRGPTASINFITCHDGFTLMDLFSYNGKHNEANGEDNNDGGNDNYSWNCGWEGESTAEGVNFLRRKLIKNALTILMLSRGVPMILSGDELGNTQFGNNNAYCQDNKISWLDWNNLRNNHELFAYAKEMIAFRNNHPVLRGNTFFRNRDYMNTGYADISWHGTQAWNADWGSSSRTLAFLLDGKHAKGGSVEDNAIYAAMNMHWESHNFALPAPPEGKTWHVAVNTDMPEGRDIFAGGEEPTLANQTYIIVGPRSIVILVGK